MFNGSRTIARGIEAFSILITSTGLFSVGDFAKVGVVGVGEASDLSSGPAKKLYYSNQMVFTNEPVVEDRRRCSTEPIT